MHAERQRDVFIGRHVIEQAEILQHDPDPFAQIGDLVLAEQRDVVAEQVDQAAGRPQRQEQQLQQRGLAGAGRPGEELEGMGRNLETEVAQNLRAEPVAQSDIFEPNQAQLRSMRGVTGNLKTGHLGPGWPRSQEAFCFGYGFRFVNGRLVASGCPASEFVNWRCLVAQSRKRGQQPVLVENGSMQIVCPHCSTSYGIDPATLGEAGRTVRCSRCKEVWLARPEDAVEFAGRSSDGRKRRRPGWTRPTNGSDGARADDDADTPVVDSPSIRGDWQRAAEDRRA